MENDQPSLDTAEYSSITLMEIGEPRNNDLRIVVLEVRVQRMEEQTPFGAGHPVLPDAHSSAFELIWHHYVGYNVRNESFAVPEDTKTVSHGRWLSTKDESAYLRYLSTTTFARDDFPGKLVHWSLFTEWHCVDVVSVTAPEIRKLDPEETARYRAKAA